jgi:hypothetical protein
MEKGNKFRLLLVRTAESGTLQGGIRKQNSKYVSRGYTFLIIIRFKFNFNEYIWWYKIKSPIN